MSILKWEIYKMTIEKILQISRLYLEIAPRGIQNQNKPGQHKVYNSGKGLPRTKLYSGQDRRYVANWLEMQKPPGIRPR
jgi:hypothetical protein